MPYNAYHGMPESLFPTDDEIDDLLVGPDSLTWQFGSDIRLFLTMLYPLLLQVAHPTVGAGVRDYSDFERRPWNRLFGTLDYLLVLQYGGHDAAAMGRRLRDLHKGFKGVKPDGARYYALEPDAYAWVHATLLDAYVSAHAQFGRPMSPDQAECFYREYLGLGRLVGVREGDLPADWRGFRAYFDRTVEEELEHTDSVDRVLRAVRHAAFPNVPFVPDLFWKALRLPASRALYVCGVGLLPPRLRERLGARWGSREQREFWMIGAASRGLTPLMPRQLLVSGPTQLRWRRRAIARGPLGAEAGHNGRGSRPRVQQAA
jgi:uncharacterized protein (DUF2236 family)